MAIQIIHPDGRIERPTLPGEPTLAQLQAWVGGYIEVPGRFYTAKGQVQFVCNEEGKLEGLDTNPAATDAYFTAMGRDPRFGRQAFPYPDVLVGTVVILTAPNLLS